jgi:selenide,water dikinase
MGPGTLSQVLREITHLNQDPRLLIGLETTDDAAVYQLDDQQALIQTLDFFTPVVDDPYLFGQIAAANALSDVYAMGGTPLLALNIACFPTCLPVEMVGAILKGGADKVREAGALIAGGHTVEDEEPKYGLAVTGLVHPDRVISNAGARVGDLLILTKPLGTGIILTAAKAGLAQQDAVARIEESMATLNREAAQAMLAVGVSACTDITGFGFLGHLHELAAASGVMVEVAAEGIPLFPAATELAQMGLVPGGAYRNREYLAGKVAFAPEIGEELQDVLFDPQTSGGLLISVPQGKEGKLLAELARRGVSEARLVGRVVAGSPGRIKVVPQL